jgi:exonuclease SbcD
MRILHTSDWHLGQHFMGKTRQAEHAAFIDWLLEQVTAHQVDAVIVAGDIFDNGAPPSYARELYNRFVAALGMRGAALVLLGGNHDSVATLGESRPLFSRLGVHVVAAVDDDPARQVLVLAERSGKPGAIVCAIPFIRPRDVLQSQPGESATAKQQSLQDAIVRHYQAVFAAAQAQRETLGLPLPIIATGHLATVGANAGEAVREIYVGALEAFPTAAFPPADYIALGHIHRPMRVGGAEHIRYSGSPIALAFDESAQQKEVLLVDLSADGLRAVTPLAVPCWQPLLSLRGDLDALAQRVTVAAADGRADRPLWLDLQVRGDDYLSDLQSRVSALVDGLPVEVLRIRRERDGAARLQAEARETLDELTPLEVFSRRLALETLDETARAELDSRYRAVLEHLQEDNA